MKKYRESDLDKFFQQWIYGEYFPSYIYKWETTAVDSGHLINLNIEQVQTNTCIFWMPIDVQVKTADGDSMIFVVWDSLQNQSFNL